MNIKKALQVLELCGGNIYRGKGNNKVTLYYDKSKPWVDFLKLRVALLFEDLTAIDWKHSNKTE